MSKYQNKSCSHSSQTGADFEIDTAAVEDSAGSSVVDPETVRVIAIDIDDTLLDFNACAIDCMKQGFAETGLNYREEYAPVFHAINRKLWDQIERGQLSIPELKRIRWNTIFQELGIEADGVEFEHIFRRYLFDSHTPVDGALEAVLVLRKRWPLYIVSNGEDIQQKNRLRKAGILDWFEDVFSSEALGVKKPHPGFFAGCMEAFHLEYPDLKPEEVLIIGDSIHADIQGGKKAGWQTFHFSAENGWDQVLKTLMLESIQHAD